MSVKLKEITNKRGNVLSKILGINSDSYPNTRVIAKMQARINNPLFKLCIADYELMCGNKMIIKIMSKVLECDEKHLKKFCKYINVFNENINLSPKSIKNKIIGLKKRGSIDMLPDDIYRKIIEQYKSIFGIKYMLRDWISLNKLDWRYLSININAIELLRKNRDKIDWELLSANPAAIELLRENQDKINWLNLASNTRDWALVR